jgi:hypothetical protein
LIFYLVFCAETSSVWTELSGRDPGSGLQSQILKLIFTLYDVQRHLVAGLNYPEEILDLPYNPRSEVDFFTLYDVQRHLVAGLNYPEEIPELPHNSRF